MMHVAKSARFQRAYKKIIQGRPALQAKFAEKIRLFIEDPHHPSLDTHSLSGKLDGMWAFSLTFKLRVVFSFSDANYVTLENIGPHDAVY
jgi:mRNA-degrading endonuclease YafQ of YafQ-DinJ toxin-antitoxin module